MRLEEQLPRAFMYYGVMDETNSNVFFEQNTQFSNSCGNQPVLSNHAGRNSVCLHTYNQNAFFAKISE